MREIDVLFLYEHVDRELDVACLVKHLAKERQGLTVEIVQHPFGALRADLLVGDLKPHLVLTPHAYHSATYSPYLFDWPEAVYINLMWEQLLYPGNRKMKRPLGMFSTKHMLHHVWGEFAAEFLLEEGIPLENIFVNGNLAYQLYSQPYSSYYTQRPALAHKYGLDASRTWVFFPENYNWAFYGDDTLTGYIQSGQRAEDVYGMRDFCRSSLQEVIRWCADIARGGGAEVVVRPRPYTPLGTFSAMVSDTIGAAVERLHVVKGESVREWILASDAVVSSYSTSLIEAAVAGKPAFMVEPYPIPASLHMNWHEHTPRLKTRDEFMRLCLAPQTRGGDDRLGDWARRTLMSPGDAILNLVDWLAKVHAGEAHRPPTVARRDILSPQGNRIRNRFEYQYHRLRRKYQHWRVGVTKKNVKIDSFYEKDLVSQREITQRVEKWRRNLLQPVATADLA